MAQDALLVRALPQLRRVVLPIDRNRSPNAKAAVEVIRQVLTCGSGGTGPSHEVEVEGCLIECGA